MRANSAKSLTTLVPAPDSLRDSQRSNEKTATDGGAILQHVSRAISLKRRGGVENDALVVRRLSARLRVELLARPIHPWDRDRPGGQRSELFMQQCLEDVSIAIPQLFRKMAEIDEIEVTVLDPKARKAIIAGIVRRDDALAASGFSAGMRLRSMGLEYCRNNIGFEALDENRVAAVK